MKQRCTFIYNLYLFLVVRNHKRNVKLILLLLNLLIVINNCSLLLLLRLSTIKTFDYIWMSYMSWNSNLWYQMSSFKRKWNKVSKFIGYESLYPHLTNVFLCPHSSSDIPLLLRCLSEHAWLQLYFKWKWEMIYHISRNTSLKFFVYYLYLVLLRCNKNLL